MIRYILSIICCIAVLGTAQAASPKITPYGWNYHGGELVYSIPTTQIAVTLLIEESSFSAGQYARYGAKYLGVSCELASKSEYRVASASVSLVNQESLYNNSLGQQAGAEPKATSSKIVPFAASLSDEQRAQEAASRIFTIRRQRAELISGDVGEGVFGAGLKAALAQMNREEKQLVELFAGSTTVSTHQRTLYVQPEEGLKNYVICRLSPSEGVVPSSNLASSPIYLQITPLKMPQIDEAKVNEKGVYPTTVVDYAVAAQCQCILFNGTESLTEVLLPIFEFGRLCKLDIPKQYKLK